MIMVCRVPRLTGVPRISSEAGVMSMKGNSDRRTWKLVAKGMETLPIVVANTITTTSKAASPSSE
jgi:hypothetical protein